MIELRNVFFTYPIGVKALHDVSLTIQDGERVGIIGQNGSGKTTLMKLFNGLLRPSKGEVLINGKNASSLTIAELSRLIGYVFQNPDDQIFSSSIKEEVSFGPINLGFGKRERESLVRESLLSVELWNYRNVHPYDVGYNRRKLVTIASILAMDPKVIILDEPTTGQDPSGKIIVERLVKGLSRNKTFIVVSHDIEFIAVTCDRVIVLSEGRVVLDGPTREVFSRRDVLSKLGLNSPMIMSACMQVKGLRKDTLTVNECVEQVIKLKKK